MSQQHFDDAANQARGQAGKYDNYDYPGEWAGRRLTLRDQPTVPSQIDYDGTDKGNSEEVRHHEKRQAAYFIAYNAQKHGISEPSGLDKTPRAKIPTNRTRGVDVAETEKLPKFQQRVERIHRFLTDRARELNANSFATHPAHTGLEEHPVAQKSLEYANDALAEASAHIATAKGYRQGTGGREISSVDARTHLVNAAKSLAKAHGFLHNGEMDRATEGVALKSFAVPQAHIDEMMGHAGRARIIKPAAPFKTVAVGKDEKVEVGSDRFNELVGKAKEMAAAPTTRGGSDKPLKKLRAAKAGTKRISKVKEREAQIADTRDEASKPEVPVRDPRKVSDNQSRPKSGNPLAAKQPPIPGANL